MGAKRLAEKYLAPLARNRIARRYFGATAEQYEAMRQGKPKWIAEHAAVAELLEGVPAGSTVLDCPVGTGRFIPLYDERELFCYGVDISPDMLAVAKRNHGAPPGKPISLEVGSLFDLDRRADVAVCVRFLGHLDPDELREALAVLRRCAPVLIIGFRYGGKATPGKRVSYSREDFERALEPYRVERRIQLDNDDYWMHRCLE
jgi:ubiquinone/menaquinone biosynthesis C-methylase UbiE